VALERGANVDTRDERGATALMIAALHGHPATVAALLDRGADPNAKNEAGATPLIWGVQHLDTVRALVDHGADVNARTRFGQTALMIAAGSDASSAVARFLIERGADVNATSKRGFTPLLSAISGRDADLIKLFLSKGADPKAGNKAGWMPLHAAASVGDARTVEDLMKRGVPINPRVKGFNTTPLMWAAAQGARDVVEQLLRKRAAVNVREQFHGATALTWAAANQRGSPEIVRALLRAGAKSEALDDDGEPALVWAVRQGNPEVIRLLSSSANAANRAGPPVPAPSTVPRPSLRVALARSVPLLQRAGPSFLAKAPDGCVSCHNQSLPAMAIALAEQRGFDVDAAVVRAQARATLEELQPLRDRLLVGIGVPDPLDPAYLLLGLAAAKQPADSTTDSMVHYLTLKQARDGRWRSVFHRPPMDEGDFTNTAVSLRALQLFAPLGREEEIAERAHRATTWLAAALPITTEDRVFQILGLYWGKAEMQRIERPRMELMAIQRADGGWSQLPGLASDAYATGGALVALQESGVPVSDPAYRRGLEFLLESQYADGSWMVPTRALPVQLYFDGGFPHGRSQFISIAGTAWATMALAFAVEPSMPQ
jgi:ankyrin repeat protein